MERYLITWNGVKYKAIDTEIHTGLLSGDMMMITVASTELWDAIRDDVEGCRNDEAIRLDERIFGYLTPDELAKSDNEVQELIQGLYE